MSFSSVDIGEQLAIATKKQPVMSQQAQQRAVSKLPVFRQEGFLARVSKLPAAVQRDIEAEGVTFIYNNSELNAIHASGAYWWERNNIGLHKNGINDIHSLWGQITLTHEIGHSLQYVNGKNGLPEIYKQHELQKVFDEEVAAFRKKYPNHKGIYAMTNPQEMFAEIYTILNSDIDDTSWGMYSPLMQRYQILKENFPKCIEVVKRHIEEIRNLDNKQRDNSRLKYDVSYDSTGNVVSMCSEGTPTQYIYDPIFPEILRSKKMEAPDGKSSREEKYLSDDVLVIDTVESDRWKVCRTHSSKDNTISALCYADGMLYARAFEDKNNNSAIIVKLSPTGDVYFSVVRDAEQVVSNEICRDVTKDDFLSGNIDFKALLQKYSTEKDNESKGLMGFNLIL